MPEKRGLTLPASILKETGISITSVPRSRAFQKPNRKILRKTARIEKRKKPAPNLNRKALTRLPLVSNQTSLESDEGSAGDSDEEKQLSLQKLESHPAASASKPESQGLRAKASHEVLQDEPKEPKISRQLRAKLAEDDAEIAALERKLGLKRKKLPKSFEEDGLGDLLAEFSDLSDDDAGKSKQSKKISLSKDEEEWLRSKRRKATTSNKEALSDNVDDMDAYNSNDGNTGDDLESLSHDLSSSDFDGFETEDIKNKAAAKQRENPYIAPQTAEGEKYVPPSLRRLESGDTDNFRQLQKQIQGTLNRLSEAKVLSIASDIEKMYGENARQHVTSILLDTLFPLICDPSPLQDTFMILHGGFVAALYKTIGAEFGAQTVQRAIDKYDEIAQMNPTMRGKRLSNLITFLAELYNFHVIGSPLIYDFIRKLTSDLSEDNAELLLRIARISGFQLRQDDSTSLKDIVTLLHASMEKVGADKLSIRTKFMIETIENLKNNKVKTGIAASTIRTEHATAMKKTLGSISRSAVKATEPLRIGLEDIRNADRKGKWWIVGASFKDNAHEMDIVTQQQSKTEPITHRSSTSREIDLDQLAREQGMNTEVRRAIFVSLVSAYDYKEACTRLTKLGMKSKQKLEIPKVLVHCVGAEKTYYNRFYTKIARHLCRERNLRKAFSFAFWDIIKRVEDDVDDGDDESVGQLDTTAMVYIGKMYGELVADGVQSILLLKHMDFAHMMPKSKTFAEVFLITIFQSLTRVSKDGADQIKRIFTVTEQAPEIIAGLQLFLRKTVRKTSLIQESKARERITLGCKTAETILIDLMSNGVGRNELIDLL